MIKSENHCVGCPKEMGCMGSACPNRNVEVAYCDVCGCEVDIDELYEVNGTDFCEDCLKEEFKKRG